MYLVINRQDEIIHINKHPRNELSNEEVYANYDESIHKIIFYQGYNESAHKIVNQEVVIKTPKERVQYLINLGQLTISNTDKIDDDGNIVTKTDKEKYQDGIITEQEYRNILYSNRKNQIRNKLEYELEYGFVYNALQFQASEESTTRIVKTVNMVDKVYQLTNEYQLPTWVSNSNDENGLDVRYTFVDYQDMISFSLAMGNFWQNNFFKAKNLCDCHIELTIQELENFNIDEAWNDQS
jgi:hypothetical protein